MSVRERRVRDNPPYLDAATTSPSPGPIPNINLWLATPHPARRSREVIAVSGWRLGTERGSGRPRMASPTLLRSRSPYQQIPNLNGLTANRYPLTANT